MINGIQLITHMPLFAVNFPTFVFEVLKQIIQIAIFDIPYLDADTLFGGWLIDLPDDDQIEVIDSQTHEVNNDLKATFEELGYESRFVSRTMGSVYVVICGIALQLIIFALILPFTGKFRILLWLKRWMEKNNLLWGAVIRTLIEACLELFFACRIALNYLYAHWEDRRTFWENAEFV